MDMGVLVIMMDDLQAVFHLGSSYELCLFLSRFLSPLWHHSKAWSTLNFIQLYHLLMFLLLYTTCLFILRLRC
jgi:hypothetical protein